MQNSNKKGVSQMKNRFISLCVAGTLLISSFSVPAMASGLTEEENPAEATAFEEEEFDNQETTDQDPSQTDGFQAEDPPDEVTENTDTAANSSDTTDSGSSSGFTAEETDEQEAADGQEDTGLYQNQEANYDDPQFVNHLDEGFFDLTGASARSSYGSVHDGRFDNYTIEDGIDVSQWNGDIQWDTVADSVDFAIIRAGYRGTGSGTLNTDPYFSDNIQEALATDLDVGVYIYSQAITTEEAVEEANYILDLVEGYSLDLPIVLDYEYASGGRLETADLTNTQRTNICLAFCETIEDAGYDAMVYANQNMLTNDLDGQDIVDAGYEIWLAQYNSSATYSGDYTYWQYTSTGAVNGISGNVDLDYHYIEPDPDTTARLETPVLTSASAADEGIQVSWEPVSGASGYLVYRQNGDSGWTTLGYTEDTSYIDTIDPEQSTLYTYTVRAYRTTYEEAWANRYALYYWSSYSADGISYISLDTPEMTDATVTADGVQITWEAVEEAESYQVYRRVLGSSWTAIATSDSASYTDDPSVLESGKTYVYTVRALNGSNRSGYQSTGVRLVYLSTPELTSAAAAANGIKIDWNAVEGAEGYDVYRRISGESWAKIASTDTNTYTDTSSLEDSVTYIYTVRAYNGSDRSYYVNTGIRTSYLSMPELVRVSQSPDGLRLTWRSVDGATGYYIYRRALGSSWSRIANITDPDTTVYADDGSNLTVGTTYVYTVRAYNDTAESGYDSTGVRREYEA